MNPNETHEYQTLYNNFIKDYKRGMVSGEEVGEVIVRLAGCYSEYNQKFCQTERNLSIKAREFETQIDDNGKSLSSAKAKVLTEASDEAFEYNKAKMHIQNIEMYIGALKTLQKGILVEFSNSSL